MKLLKMGGPNLGPGQHTWVVVTKPRTPGARSGMMDINHGQTVEADRIHDPDGYVERGQASYVNEPEDKKGS